ncbi:leucine-rich repeat domain-containing protein [Flavicella sediminum]|uniref:leucine-rich repeat domain-containing protein n=1 Tax=Flavicella sediminum TaxID=2585141 RepID=UPI0011208E85|nr:leucine-rich repeat domain-containing protein [Flavicella sediminum]
MKQTLLLFITLLTTTLINAQLVAGETFSDASFNFVVTTAADPGSPNIVSLTGPFDAGAVPTSLVIPATVTEGGVEYAIKLISSQAFKGTSITSVVVNGDTEPGHQSFMDCGSLASISFPNSSGSVGAHAFRNCSALTAVNMPNIRLIGVQSFRNCTSLTSIDLPSATAIGPRATEGLSFWQCTNLQTISMPAMDSISVGAFNTTGLTSITLPASITKLNETNHNMFRNISTLTEVIVESETPLVLTYSSPGDATSSIFNTVAAGATLTVPHGTLSAYQTADVWKDFGAFVEAAPTAAINSITNESFDAYPNPVVDNLNFSTDAISSVDIYNISGVLVGHKEAFGSVDMSDLATGVYFVKCNNKNGYAISTIRVVKK